MSFPLKQFFCQKGFGPKYFHRETVRLMPIKDTKTNNLNELGQQTFKNDLVNFICITLCNIVWNVQQACNRITKLNTSSA